MLIEGAQHHLGTKSAVSRIVEIDTLSNCQSQAFSDATRLAGIALS